MGEIRKEKNQLLNIDGQVTESINLVCKDNGGLVGTSGPVTNATFTVTMTVNPVNDELTTSSVTDDVNEV